MTHLRIEQGTNIEIVTSGIIHKLYEIASGIIDYEDANQITTSQVYLKGNIQTSRAYGDEVDWLEEKFPNLHINVTGDRYIRFADPIMESYWANSQYGDGVGITAANALSASFLLRSTFKNNTNITSFNELDKFGITQIPEECFYGCSNLISINLDRITNIKNLAFFNCSSLSQIDLSNIVELGSECFYGCSSLDTVVLPSNSIGIPTYGFKNCTSLTTIDLSNVVSIYRESFCGCTSLSTIQFGNNITILGRSSFDGCTSLSGEIVIPASITTLEQTVFANCRNITSIKFLGSTPPTANNSWYGWDNQCPFTVKVPSASVEAYKTAMPNCVNQIIGY